MAKKNSGTDTRSQILQAATSVVHTLGAAQFTLENVAKEAKVSKGGLLYHFPNKEALIKGMLTNLIEQFDEALNEALGAENSESVSGKWTRAYAQATFALGQEQFNVSSALLVIVATDLNLLEPLRQKFDDWQTRAENDGLDPALATLLRLASDGLWFADLLDFAPPKAEKRAQTLATLLHLTTE